MNASPDCWKLYGEVIGFEISHPWLVGRFRQLAVDAYGAQHAGGDTRYIRVAYSLVGLHMSLRCGRLASRSATPIGVWGDPRPHVAPVPSTSRHRIEVDRQCGRGGLRTGSADGHAAAVQAWAWAVCEAWAKRARGHRAASPRRGIAAVSRWSISGRLHSGRRGRPARKGSNTVRVSAPGSVQLTVTVHAWALVFCRSLSYGVWPPSPP